MENHCALIRRNASPHRTSLTGIWCLCTFLLLACFAEQAAAQPPQAEIDAAIKRGVAFLKKKPDYGRSGMNAFVAYTLLKTGESPDSPYIQNCLKNIMADHNQKNSDGEIVYTPGGDYNYTAGVQLMVFEAISPEKYHNEIKTTVDFLIKTQQPAGSWYYPQQEPNNGDTSITQYAILGLWAAERAGVMIPTRVWDNAARWHLTTQLPNGGFGYHPGGQTDRGAKHTMGVAGTGSMYVISRQLYPNGQPRTAPTTGKEGEPKKKFGFLEKVNLTEKDKEGEENLFTKPTIALSALETGKTRGANWVVNNYNYRNPTGWPNYYLYGIERLAALADAKKLGPHDWYADGARHLLMMQLEDGSWKGSGNIDAATCLAIIFLAKATVKTIDRKYKPDPVGSGLLAGGRGLPKNLAEVQMRNGKVESKTLSGDLSELLAQLEDPATADLDTTQETLVETITIGNREDLIKQKDRVLKLIDARSPDVRRTAVWALARTNDFRMAPYLIRSLKDPDLSVRIEARNGLCTLSRKIRGLGMPEDPLADVPEDLTKEERVIIADQWADEATRRWQKWYNSVKPFDEIFNLYEVLDQLPKSKSK
ncbi:HEAT repeat domain-containing protein [Gimesia chilikensis]|uniref:Prenyltransferase and squalene oxidase repeat protein n=1 Tax=Gimesia chilikensis TaxID=2605989 RepID=A0A517PQA3_9PLAN|nr:HEAT repeat domain-containing protein [Gimesia chilikensis]QDT21557.1 Prenyltransferase and squalene oxidase repeat protein [Gimesia chilikensis]